MASNEPAIKMCDPGTKKYLAFNNPTDLRPESNYVAKADLPFAS